MTKDESLDLLRQYAEGISSRSDGVLGFMGLNACQVWTLRDVGGMADRFPADGSEKKAMRWLGYMPDLHCCNSGGAISGIGHLLLTGPKVPRAKRREVERILRELAAASGDLLRARALYEAQVGAGAARVMQGAKRCE